MHKHFLGTLSFGVFLGLIHYPSCGPISARSAVGLRANHSYDRCHAIWTLTRPWYKLMGRTLTRTFPETHIL